MKQCNFIIAAPTSNSGKTMLSLGLLRVFKNRGFSTQAFKCGPDYIDPKFHRIACGKLGINLDMFMMSDEHLLETYDRHRQDADVVCIEGVMGLFDGAKKAKGSTAELAKKLHSPIILVVDAKSVAYSVAPLLYGFKNFDPSIQIAGVIFNRVNRESHYQFLKEACDDVGILSLGYVPFLEDCQIQSRHLGLSLENINQYDKAIDKIAFQLEKTVNIDEILTLQTNRKKQNHSPTITQNTNYKIAIAQDEGFNFNYPQNIEAFKSIGEVQFFSPIHDSTLPNVDLVYFPGGYPECYTKELSSNHTMLQSVKKFAEAGGKIIAECGGMMYLSHQLIDHQGDNYSMANVLEFSCSMKKMKLKLGYRRVMYNKLEIRGHEFHYSYVLGDEDTKDIGTVWTAREKEIDTKIYRHKNVFASYIHFYFEDPSILKKLINELNA